MANYPLLTRPLQIKTMTLRNRVVMAPMGTQYADEGGFINDRVTPVLH